MLIVYFQYDSLYITSNYIPTSAYNGYFQVLSKLSGKTYMYMEMLKMQDSKIAMKLHKIQQLSTASLYNSFK